VEAARVTRVPELDEEGVKVRRFYIPEEGEPDPERLRFQQMMYSLHGRGTRLGQWYTRLDVDGRLWMSDTDAEIYDHGEVIFTLQNTSVKTVLIHGLGLGMILGVALNQSHIEQVEVVEKDERIARIIGQYYEDPRLTIYVDDALTRRWPVGQRWDVVWHDIWGDVSEDDLAAMTKLLRRFGRRAGWQGVWGRELIRCNRYA
jgi:hypothetical protein